MPIQNDIVVEINGAQHNHWKQYNIDSDFLIPADAFSFDLGVPANNGIIPDYSGEEAKVYINGTLVMTGIVDTTRHNLRKGERSFSLNGRDRASILIDCSAPITNVQGLTVLEAVKKIVKPLGIDEVELRAEQNPKLSKVDIDVGESAWEAIKRCANSAGLHCWFDPQGVLIVGGADYSSAPVATLCCMKNGSKNNFTHVELSYDVSLRYSEVTFLGQKHGTDSDKNKNNLKWVYKDEEADFYKPKTVVIGDVENLESLKKQARKQLSDWELEGFTLTITVPDHKTEDGILWEPGQRVHIIIEEYDIDAIFFLMGRRFILSRMDGTQTELRLKQDGVWTPDAYEAKAEKAKKRKGKKGKKVKEKKAKAKKGRKKKVKAERIDLSSEK
ncbi:phage tail protein [Pasteurellaceae bacterium 15-036681]|nr:phage tail protein [Pasteurellaceae bacterium 15-036681]